MQLDNEIIEPPARFCSKECREEYRSDRIAGIALPQYDGMFGHKTVCAQKNLCTFCLEGIT